MKLTVIPSNEVFSSETAQYKRPHKIPGLKNLMACKPKAQVNSGPAFRTLGRKKTLPKGPWQSLTPSKEEGQKRHFIIPASRISKDKTLGFHSSLLIVFAPRLAAVLVSEILSFIFFLLAYKILLFSSVFSST